MKSKGFTLVELLAVIVILAIILAIAIPSISGMINSTTKSTFESNAKMVLQQLEYKKMENSSFIPSEIDETNVKEELNLDDSNYETLTVKEINGIIYLTIVGKNKWDNLTVSATKIVSKANDTVTDFVRGANAPVLVTGMTPIKWNGTTWVDTTKNDTDWYNYNTTDKKWANARTADGSMWVWIPRYIYKISEANWHTTTAGTINIQFSKGVNDNWNKDAIGNIDLREGAEASNNYWTNHPAFTFGDIELTGIWVSKFEASSSNPTATNGGGNVTNLKYKSLPNVASWRAIAINNIFTVTRTMGTDDTYGWGTTGNGIDTHLIKNTEWGAVAYLSQSIYGKNAEVWINNSNTFITGCAGASVSAASDAGCANTYNTPNGMQASTTGNIYGVYDMSGGAYEYVAAYVDNGNSNLSNGSLILGIDNKYKNTYKANTVDSELDNYVMLTDHKGDALYETSLLGTGTTSWYSDYSFATRTTNPWTARGGYNDNNSHAGIFSFGNYSGNTYTIVSFRAILLINESL